MQKTYPNLGFICPDNSVATFQNDGLSEAARLKDVEERLLKNTIYGDDVQ